MYSGKFVEKINKKRNRGEYDDEPLTYKKFRNKNNKPKRSKEDEYEYQRPFKKSNR